MLNGCRRPNGSLPSSYISDVKRQYKSAEAFIDAENRALQEQVDELDNAYVRSQREVYELRKTLRKQKKLLDRMPKEVLAKTMQVDKRIIR